MPSIVNSRGVNLTTDVVQIGDAFPSSVRRKERMYTEQENEGNGRVVILDAFEMARLADKMARTTEDAADCDAQEAPATSLLAAEILQNAQAEADHVLAEAQEMAQAEKEKILASARVEAEALRQNALTHGHQEGLNSCVAGMQNTINALEASIARLEGEVAGFEAEYEEQLKWMAMEIATRVLNRKVAENDSILAGMVAKVVQGLKNEPWIRVEVAQDMTRLIGQLQDLFDTQEHIDVSPIPADPGTLLVETASGVVDASLHTQLKNLKQYFQLKAD